MRVHLRISRPARANLNGARSSGAPLIRATSRFLLPQRAQGQEGSYTYWIVCPKVTSKVPKIAIFRNWLSAEAAEAARRLKSLDGAA